MRFIDASDLLCIHFFKVHGNFKNLYNGDNPENP